MLLEQLTSSLKDAMIKKDVFKTSVLRMLIASIHNREIEKKAKGQELLEDDIFDVLRKEVKKRKDASVMYQSGGRQESANEEEKEVQFIEGFLPAQMSQEEIETIVANVLKNFESPTQKDFGVIIKAVKEKTGNNADGGVIAQIVKKYLSQ
jgi:uncharacterized protein YqeY